MRYIYKNSVGLEAEQGHKVKFKVLTLLNFLTPPSFSVTLPSYDPKKTRRDPKVQRSPNFKFNFGPRSASDHAQPAHIQCIYNLNKIENVKLLLLKLQIS